MTDFVYMDNAATTFPKPPEVIQFMCEFYTTRGVNPGRTGFDLALDGIDADLSGSVTLRGTATDNQRIQAIKITIEDFDAGHGLGMIHPVASWQGGTLVSEDVNFLITSQQLSESAGHQVSWKYTWDSSGITNSAARDIGVERQMNGCTLAQPLAQDEPVVLFVVRQPSAGSSKPRSSPQHFSLVTRSPAWRLAL